MVLVFCDVEECQFNDGEGLCARSRITIERVEQTRWEHVEVTAECIHYEKTSRVGEQE